MIKELRKGVFEGCINLSEIKVQEGLKKIGESAFADCQKIFKFILPGTLQEIEEKAFSGCFSLSSMILPDKVSKIGAYAFENCCRLAILVAAKVKVEVTSFVGCRKVVFSVIEDFGQNDLQSGILNEGQKVLHKFWGIGQVLGVEKGLVRIDFKGFGGVQLLSVRWVMENCKKIVLTQQ